MCKACRVTMDKKRGRYPFTKRIRSRRSVEDDYDDDSMNALMMVNATELPSLDGAREFDVEGEFAVA